jgi:hypothetical protein
MFLTVVHSLCITLDIVRFLQYIKTIRHVSGSASVIRCKWRKGSALLSNVLPPNSSLDGRRFSFRNVVQTLWNTKTARWADMPWPFLGNGSVNTFQQQRVDTQQWRYCWKRGISMWSVPRSYLKDNWGDRVSASWFYPLWRPDRIHPP